MHLKEIGRQGKSVD